jgi:hypothetical protein
MRPRSMTRVSLPVTFVAVFTFYSIPVATAAAGSRGKSNNRKGSTMNVKTNVKVGYVPVPGNPYRQH